MPKKYIVRLTDGERETLHQILKKRGVAAQRVRRASIVLKADVDGPSWADAKIADAFGCRTQTVENMRESLVTEGFETGASRLINTSELSSYRRVGVLMSLCIRCLHRLRCR